jgi:hypothetical protein
MFHPGIARIATYLLLYKLNGSCWLIMLLDMELHYIDIIWGKKLHDQGIWAFLFDFELKVGKWVNKKVGFVTGKQKEEKISKSEVQSTNLNEDVKEEVRE